MNELLSMRRRIMMGVKNYMLPNNILSTLTFEPGYYSQSGVKTNQTASKEVRTNGFPIDNSKKYIFYGHKYHALTNWCRIVEYDSNNSFIRKVDITAPLAIYTPGSNCVSIAICFETNGGGAFHAYLGEAYDLIDYFDEATREFV